MTQSRDRFLEAQLPASFASAAYATAQAGSLRSVTALNPDGGLTTALGDFYSGLRALNQNAGDPSLRQAAVSGAKSLALAFNQTSNAINSARSGLDAQISNSVGEVNTLTRSMADLNQQIVLARNGGAEPNDLLDARQKTQDRLSEMLGAVPVPDGQGNISMSLANGQSLVSGNRASQFAAVSDPSNGGLTTLRMTLPDGAPQAVDMSQVGGEIGGAIAARDGTLKQAKEDVDTLAFDFANTLNAVHSAGYGQDGNTGRNLFTVNGTSANAASSLKVDAAVAADPRLLAAADSAGSLPGGSANLLNLIASETIPLSGGKSVSATLSHLTSTFGAATSSAIATADHLNVLHTSLTNMRESASGVSIDEETVNLTRAQRGYEAVAKVMQVTNDMLDTLMSLKSS